MEKYIIVNATALDKGGALSILKQFVDNIPEDNLNWLVFSPKSIIIDSSKKNVRVEPIAGLQPMYRRFWWDAYGLNRWLKVHDVDPLACLSLQNTGFRVSKKKTPKFIYYHQPIPFYDFKWNPLKSSERLLWFYKRVYPFFVRLFLTKDTKIFVQLKYIKDGFVKTFRHNPQNVEVYSPDVTKMESTVSVDFLNKESLNLFYPASSVFYKNQAIIINATIKIDKGVTLFLTTQNNLRIKKIKELGTIPYSTVCSLYRSCDAMLFPSYIETFGLPLLEAAMTGLPIVASDLPYAREVLAGYEGAVFVKYNDEKSWINAIEHLTKGVRYNPIDISSRPGWNELFKTIKSSL